MKFKIFQKLDHSNKYYRIIDAYLFWNDIFILIHYIFDVTDHGLVMIVWEKWHLLQPNIAFHMSLNISFVFFLMKVKLYFFYCMNFCNIIWFFSGYCADPVLGLSQHEIDACSEYVHAFMGPAFRGFFKSLNFNYFEWI